MGLDVDLKNICTVHKDSSGGTSVFPPVLKPAGCSMPPWLRNQTVHHCCLPTEQGRSLSCGSPREMWEALHLNDLSKLLDPRVK